MPARTLSRLAAAILAAIFLAACASPPEPPPQPAPVAARACHTPPEVVGQVTLANPGARVLGFLTGEKAARLFRQMELRGVIGLTGDAALLFTNPEETVLFVVTFVNGCADRQIRLQAGAA